METIKTYSSQKEHSRLEYVYRIGFVVLLAGAAGLLSVLRHPSGVTVSPSYLLPTGVLVALCMWIFLQKIPTHIVLASTPEHITIHYITPWQEYNAMTFSIDTLTYTYQCKPSRYQVNRWQLTLQQDNKTAFCIQTDDFSKETLDNLAAELSRWQKR